MRVSFLKGLAVVCISTLVGLGLAEVVLRVIGYARPPLLVAHEVRGFALRPNVGMLWTYEGRAWVETNSAGFRDLEHSVHKPAGVFRVAVLGDSFVEALQVPVDSTFWKRLEPQLARCLPQQRVEVMSFGVSGYGTGQELLTYRTAAASYRPDLVLLAVLPTNDVRENSSELAAINDRRDAQRDEADPRRQRPYFTLRHDTLQLDTTFKKLQGSRERLYRLAQAVAARSRLVQLVWAARRQSYRDSPVPSAGTESGLDVEVYRDSVTPAWQRAWAITEALIKQVNLEVKNDGARLVVVALSQGIQVHPDSAVTHAFTRGNGIADLFYPDKRVAAIARSAGIPAIMLGPPMRGHALSTRAYLHGFDNTPAGSGHWNVTGHRVAADIVSDSLCSMLKR